MINVKSWLYKFVLLSSLPLASALATNDVAADNSDYAPRVLTNGAVSLASPMQRLQAQIDAQGATLTVAHEQGADQQVSVRPISLGREQQQPVSAGQVVTDAQRVLLKRQQLIEVFSSSMHGVRQDFLISQRPQGDGALSLSLAFQGANVVGAGQGVSVTTANGRELSYHKLQVIDADGQRLAATMRATAHNRLTIEVDDRAARYPVLIDPTFSDANWQAFAPDAGGSPNNQVRAMVEYQGDLYVGGTFAQVAGEQVYYIARWNGYRWQKLGDGVNNAVYAMTVFNDKLIVGGSFTTASGVSAMRIASWDGSSWQALGDGLNSSAVDLTVYNGELIVGGIFTAAGGISVNRIARWDGSNWHAMGGPDHGTVNSVSEFDGDLIVVGSFYQVNGENHNYITRWDGSSWSPLGDGMNTVVNDAVEFQGKLYVTGQFTGSGGSGLPYIAVWDGSTWLPVGSGLSDAGYSLYADNDKLYVGGQFETAGGINSLAIAAWDGSSWQAVGDGLGLYAGTVIRIYRILKFDNEIVLGGLLDKNGAVNLVRLNNDSEWQGFQSTFLDGSTQVVAEYDGDTIVGGDFTEISGVAANRVARWDGSQWHAMGDGFNGTVTTIASYQGELYAAGAFDHSGSSAVAHVARWDSDGQTWQPLTTGVNNTVYRVKVINDELWILGDFSSAGGESATGMARWDGSQWLSVDFPYQVHYGPTDVVEYQGEVVVSGRFYNPEGFLLFKVAAFDGEQWYPLELDAVTGMVLSMAVHDDVLYVTGNIYRMNESVSASGVAAWDGSQWSNVGDSDVGSGKTLQSFKQELFLGSDSGLYVLKDGTFQQPDTSVNQLINGLDAANDSLYLTGSFSSAGGKTAQNLARLIPTVSVSLDEQQGAGAVATQYFPGSTIKLPQPTREHYNFTGWNTAGDGSGLNYTTNLPLTSSAVSLYAQWQLKSYTISFDSAGGSSVADMEVAYGASVTAPTAPTRTGYTFTGWSPELPSTMPGEDLTVTAQWQINSYTLTFDSAGGSTVPEQTLDYGAAISVPSAPTRANYSFAGWQPALPTTMPAQDLTVTAQWLQNAKVTATASVNGNGSISPASRTVNSGQTASFTLTLGNSDDYVVLGGSCAASRSGQTITTAALTKSCTLTVNVYDATDAEKDQSGPVGGSQAVGFRLNGGAGDKALQWVDRLRGGVETRLKGAEAEALISLQEDGSFIFLAELTGRYSLRFRDEVSGEITELSFDVMPYLAFSASRQLAQQDQTVDVGVWLSDEPIESPVSATLTRDALGQSPLALSFDEPQSLQQVLSMQASASATEVQLTLADIEQALAGSPATTTLRLTEQALPLTVQLSSHQASEQQTRIVSRDSGVVTLTAALKSGADAEFSWQSDIDLSVAGSSASFDPQSVDNGSYLISVEATAAERSGQAEITLTVVDSCPDNDCAGLVKGLPTAADQNAERLNRLAICPAAVGSARSSACGENEDGFIEVPSLYTLTLGVLSAEQSWQSQQFGTVLNDASLGEDEGFNQLGAMVNFNVVDITAPGDIVPVAIPLVSGVSIPQGAVWRKWIDGQWQTFVEDDSNRIDSAEKMSNGRCPVVSADSWTPGLSAGHGCVRLFIEDGGPNDDDGQVNGSIRDPGVLAIDASIAPEPPTEPTRPAETRSGGNIGGGLLLLLGALLGLRTRAVRQALKRSALMALAVLGVTHQAAAQEWYLGAEALQIHSDVKAEQVEADLAALGYADSGVNIDDKSRQGLRLYGGWQVNPVLAFELAWVDTNEITTSFARLPEDVDTDSLKDVWPVSGKGPELSLLLTPFTDSEQWRPGVRLGVWRMRSDSDFRQGRTVQTLENDDTVMVLEAFTRYQVNSHWAVKLGVSHYRLHAAPMNTVTVGLNYRF